MPTPNAPQANLRTIFLPNYGMNINVPSDYTDDQIDAAVHRNHAMIQQQSPVAQRVSGAIGQSAAGLGITPQQASQYGVNPAIPVANRQAQIDAAQSAEQLSANRPMMGPAAQFNPQAQTYGKQQGQKLTQATATAEKTGGFASDVNQRPLLGTMDQNTWGALQQMQGFGPGLAKGLLGMTSPEGIETLLAAAPLGAVGGGRAVLGGFAAQAAPGMIQQATQGDPGGALGNLAAFALPMGLHAAYAHAFPGAADVTGIRTDGRMGPEGVHGNYGSDLPTRPMLPPPPANAGLLPPGEMFYSGPRGVSTEQQPFDRVSGVQGQFTPVEPQQGPFYGGRDGLGTQPPAPAPPFVPQAMPGYDGSVPRTPIDEYARPLPDQTQIPPQPAAPPAPSPEWAGQPHGNAPLDPPFQPTHFIGETPVTARETPKGVTYFDESGKRVFVKQQAVTEAPQQPAPTQQDFTEYPKPSRMQMLEFDHDRSGTGTVPQGAGAGNAEPGPTRPAIEDQNVTPAAPAAGLGGEAQTAGAEVRGNGSKPLLTISQEADGSIRISPHQEAASDTRPVQPSSVLPSGAEPGRIGSGVQGSAPDTAPAAQAGLQRPETTAQTQAPTVDPNAANAEWYARYQTADPQTRAAMLKRATPEEVSYAWAQKQAAANNQGAPGVVPQPVGARTNPAEPLPSVMPVPAESPVRSAENGQPGVQHEEVRSPDRPLTPSGRSANEMALDLGKSAHDSVLARRYAAELKAKGVNTAAIDKALAAYDTAPKKIGKKAGSAAWMEREEKWDNVQKGFDRLADFETRRNGKTGPQNLNAGVSFKDVTDALKNVAEGTKDLRSKATSFLYGDKPVLRDLAPDSQHTVTQHERAWDLADHDSTRHIAHVTEPLTPLQKAKFGTYGVADRMIAFRDKTQGEITALNTRQAAIPGELKAARAAGRGLKGRAAQAAFDKVDALKAEQAKNANDITDKQAQLSKIALGRATNPLSVNYGGKKLLVTEAGVKKFYAEPEVKEALTRYKATVEKKLADATTTAGGRANGIKGANSGAYFPAQALDASGTWMQHGAGAGANSGGLHGAMAQLAKAPNQDLFEGSGKGYEPDFGKVISDQYRRTYDAATERLMWHQLGKDNLARDMADTVNVRRTSEGKLETQVNGKWEPAVNPTIQRANRGGVGSLDKDIPTTPVLPARVWNEIKPLYERQHADALDSAASKFMKGYYEKYLAAPADLVQHSFAMGSRVAAVNTKGLPLPQKAALALLGPVRSAANTIRFFHPDLFTDAQRSEATRFAIQSGIGRENFSADRGGNPFKIGAAKLKGEQGVLANAATAIYQNFKDRGALATPEGKQMVRDAIREAMNTSGQTDASGLGQISRKVGLGTFYQTGVKNRAVIAQQGPTVLAATLAGHAILNALAVKALDDKHRYPWQIPGYKWGTIPVGKTATGDTIYHSLPDLLDRTGSYASDAILDTANAHFANKESGKQTALNAVVHAANWLMPPLTSSPVVSVGSSMVGLTPHIKMNDKMTGIDFTPNYTAGMKLDDWRRGVSTAANALPLSNLFGANMAESQGKSHVGGPANLALRALGLPQMRAGINEAKALQASQRQRNAEAKIK